MKRYDCGDIRPVEWLDNLAFRQIEKIHKVKLHNKQSRRPSHTLY